MRRPPFEFEKVRLVKKKLVFPPALEKAFKLNGLLSKQSFFIHVVSSLFGINLLIQYLNFKGLEMGPSLFMAPLIVMVILSKNKNNIHYMDWWYSLSLFFSGLSIVYVIVRFPDNFLNFIFLIVLMISGFIFFNLRSWACGVIGISLMAAYSLSVFLFNDIPDKLVWNYSFFLLLITIIGIIAGYVIEYYSRKMFLKNSVLNKVTKEIQEKEIQKNNELTRANKSLELEILAHMEAESQLSDSEQKYRSLVSHLPQGVVIVQKGKIVFSNPSIEQLTGFDAKSIKGKNIDHFIVRKPFNLKSNPNQSNPVIHDRLIRSDGVKIHIEKSVVPIKYHMKPADLYSIQDITDKVLAGQEKKQLQKELNKAKKMEALGLLAGGVAHDLNNVLSGLVSTPDVMLADLPCDSELIQHVEVIKDSGKRAAVIVEDLLILARGSSKPLEPVLFNHVIEDYLISPEFAHLKAHHPKVDFIKELDSDLPYIDGSGIQIRKVVMNLVSNAMEAVGRQKGQVGIRTQKIRMNTAPTHDGLNLNGKACVRVTIWDTGQGISSQDLDHIFEPFYSRKILGRSGTGLGLSIVWNAVQDHFGTIKVDSCEGKTQFTLYFPVLSRSIISENTDFQVYTLSDYKGNGETVLVVDDMEIQRKITVTMLKRLGYRAVAVSSGEKALEIAATESIDLVILDMVLESGMNGLETFRQLLLIDSKIKAIIASGYDITDDVIKAQHLGAGEYVKKPFSLEKVGLAIKKELSDKEIKR